MKSLVVLMLLVVGASAMGMDRLKRHRQAARVLQQHIHEHGARINWYKAIEEGSSRFVRKFGVEIELKCTRIPDVDANPGQGLPSLKLVRLEVGHIGILTGAGVFEGWEIHLDSGDDDASAVLELVTTPPQSMDELTASLDRMRKNAPVHMGTLDKLKAALANAALWVPKDANAASGVTGISMGAVYAYIQKNLAFSKVNTLVFPNMVQVTSSFTAWELVTLFQKTGGFPTFMTATVPGGPGMPSRTIAMHAPTQGEQKNPDTYDEFIQVGYLGALPEFQDNGKGTNALIKHAAEQFTAGAALFPKTYPRNPQLGPDVQVGELYVLHAGGDRKEEVKHNYGLHTLANKLAPAMRRSDGVPYEGRPDAGKVAYVIEFRGGGGFGNDRDPTVHVAKFMSDTTVTAVMLSQQLAADFPIPAKQ